jgi:site-specific DNA recombinase
VGYACYGKRLSPSARTGKPRAYAYYRCLGPDAYRFGGERLWQNTQVRTDLLALAVWQEVCTVLAHPERLAEEYRRRLQPETHTRRPSLTTVEGQMSQVRQGIARLIDSYAASLIDKHAFAPRIPRLRQRLARLEEPRQALADEAALQGELQLIIGRLEECAAKLHGGLEAADWVSKRDLSRALVKRGEVAQNDVNIVFRIDPYPGDADPEKKVGNFVGGVLSPLVANIYLHYVLDLWAARWRRRHARGDVIIVRYCDGTPVQACNT